MGKATKPTKSIPSEGKKESGVGEVKKLITAKEKELEEKFSRYGELVKQYADQQSSSQQQRDRLEELTESVKKQRLICRTLQCDAILVANENELLKKKVEIVENKVKTLKEKCHSKKKSGSNAAAGPPKAEKKAGRKGKAGGGKTIKGKTKDKPDQEPLQQIKDVEEVALDLKQEIADKTRSLYMRTGDITPFMAADQKSEDLRSLSTTDGGPRSA